MMGEVIRLLSVLWVTGTALSILPTWQAVARLTTRDPRRMCPGCRARRRAQQQVEREWYGIGGHAGMPFMILSAASLWWVAPVLPVVRQWAGLASMARCAGRGCAAHPRYPPV